MKTIDRSIVAGLLIMAVVCSGCGRKRKVEALPPRPAIIHVVEAPSSTMVRTFSGVTAAAGSVHFGFEVGGRVIQIAATSGQRYGKGDVLARLDTTSFEQEANRLRADAQRVAQDLARVQQLYENDNASKGDLDAAIAAQKAAQAALANAELNVANGTLRMPYEGTVGDVLAEEQDIVSAGTPVVLLQGEGPIEFKIGVPAELIQQVKLGQQGVLMLTTSTAHRLDAVVTEIVPRAMRNTTYPVTLEVRPNAGVSLIDGMDGEIVLHFSNPAGEIIRVPAVSVLSGPDGERYVWVVGDDDTVDRNAVKTGKLRADGMVEILDGLKPGMRVVARGAQNMEPGLAVSPRTIETL